MLGIMSDGFDRSICALRKAGAIDTKKMQKDYNGVGSRYYDLVTAELEYTAKCAAPEIVNAISKEWKKHIK